MLVLKQICYSCQQMKHVGDILTQLKQYFDYLKKGLVDSLRDDKKSFYIFLVVPLLSVFLALILSKYIGHKITFILLGIIALVYGTWLHRNNKWWQKISSYYFDTYVNKLAIKATADEYAAGKIWLRNLYIAVSMTAPVLWLWSLSTRQGEILRRILANLSIVGIPVIFFPFVDVGFVLLGLAIAFAVLVIIWMTVIIFLIWPLFQFFVYLLYFIFMALLITSGFKLFVMVQAYRKALEIRSLAESRSLYSLEEFNQRVFRILSQTKSALPEYWEEKFKLREIRLLVEKMKLENKEKEMVLDVLKKDLHADSERGLI